MARGVSRSRRRGRAFWEHLVAQYEASGRSQAAFARGRGVKVCSLQYWIYKLRRAAREHPVRLVPVEIRSPIEDQSPSEQAPRSSSPFELVTPGGVVLRFPVGAEIGYLSALVSELKRC
jgi:hypothetical protein